MQQSDTGDNSTSDSLEQIETSPAIRILAACSMDATPIQKTATDSMAVNPVINLQNISEKLRIYVPTHSKIVRTNTAGSTSSRNSNIPITVTPFGSLLPTAYQPLHHLQSQSVDDPGKAYRRGR